MTPIENPAEIIGRLGGTTKTANLCEVSAQAVSQWRHNGIPRTQLKYLRATRPEIFEPDWKPMEPPTDTTLST
jgi:hypothetical protein